MYTYIYIYREREIDLLAVEGAAADASELVLLLSLA